MNFFLILSLSIFITSCGQNYHLSLEELTSITPHNSILTGPVGPVGFDKDTSLKGSCKSEGANGKVVITTLPANGFSPNYDTEVNLDANGEFDFPVSWVPNINYAIVLKCINSDDEELSIQEHNSFGVAEMTLDNPGHLFLGKPKILSGTCSPLLPDGSTDVLVSGATPATVTCSCTGGSLICPPTIFTDLPELLDFSVSYMGASAEEMGYSSCPPYTEATDSREDFFYRRTNVGNVTRAYTHSSNFNGTDGFGLSTKGGGVIGPRLHPSLVYDVNDVNNGNARELNYSGITANIPICQNNQLFQVGDSLDIRYTTQGVGRYALRFKTGATPNGAPTVWQVRRNVFAGASHTRSITITGDITNFYSRVYFVDDQDSARMIVRYRVNGGAYLPIPREWISSSSGDARLSVVGLTSPDAQNDLVTGVIDTPVDVDVLLNDTDDVLVDGSTLTVLENADAITEGTCSIGAGPGYLLTFTPVLGFTGQASCGYRVCDNQNTCDTARALFNY